jgi:hypothetical protein
MSTEPVTNSDVLLWALYELGGAEEFVDVETAFIRAFELAPLRLGWRTRPDLPDLKKCSKALRDAEVRKPRLLVKKGPERRRLTVEGQEWIEDNFDRLAEALGPDRVVRAPRTRAPSRLVRQALQSEVFTAWNEGGTITEKKWRIAEILRCSPDSSRALFRERLETFRSAAHAAGRLDALEFFDALAKERADWF